jgi:hypothetical protein
VCKHLIKLLTASQDLHKSHIRNLKSQCGSSHKSELRLGHFNTQNLLLQTSLTRSLGTCQLILISPTGIPIIRWIFMKENSQKNSSKKSHSQYLTQSVQSNFRSLSWSLVRHHTPIPKEASPMWTKA